MKKQIIEVLNVICRIAQALCAVLLSLLGFCVFFNELVSKDGSIIRNLSGIIISFFVSRAIYVYFEPDNNKL